MDASDWRKSLSFSSRFASISNIAAVLENLQGISPGEARVRAKEAERTLYNEAASLDEYNSKCADAAEPSPLLTETISQHDDDDTFDSDESSPSDLSFGKYTNVRHFRDGLYSFVYRARAPAEASSSDAKGKVVALKVTTPTLMSQPHDSEREARILNTLHHPSIIPLVDVFHTSGSRLVIVFPFMPYDLQSLIRDERLDRGRVSHHVYEMFDALKFIHSHGYIHRDIKPSNILMKTTSGPAYLADFGIAWSPIDAASEPRDDKITDVGTTCYRPPELLFGNKRYGCTLDLWAAGCTVAEVANRDGTTLFDSGDLGSELALIQSIFMTLGTPTSETWPEAAHFPDWGKMKFREYPQRPWTDILPTASQDAQDLVSKLVKFESKERLTAAEALDHPLFLSISSQN